MDKQSLEAEKRQTRANGSQKHGNMGEVPRAQSKLEVKQTAEDKEKESRPKEAIRSVENEKRSIRKKEGGERRQRSTFEQEENEKKLKAALEQMENDRRLKEALEQEEKEKRIKEARLREENEKKQREAYEKQEEEKRLRAVLEQEENERRLKEALVKEENDRRLKEIHEKEEFERRLREAADREENERRQRKVREREENEKRLKETLEKEEDEKRLRENEGRLREAHQREENEKRVKEALEHENKKKQKELNEREGIEKKCKQVFGNEGIEESLEREATEKRLEETNEQEESGKLRETPEGQESELGTCKSEETGDASQETSNLENNEVKHKDDSENDKLWILNDMGENCRVMKQACKLNGNRDLGSTRLTGKHEGKNGKQEVTGEIAHEELGKVPPGLKIGEKEAAVEIVNLQVNGKTKVSGVAQGSLEHEKHQSVVEDDAVFVYGDERMRKAGEAGNGTGQKSLEKTKKASQIESDIANQGKEFPQDRGDRRKNIPQAVAMNHEGRKDNFMSNGAVKKSVETGRKIEAAQPANLEAQGSTMGSTQQLDISERKMKNLNKTRSSEEKEAERMRREKELEMEHLRKLEEEREREREREKDRMAVDRAALEARERVHTEARDRAERAAVERAITEARERLEKACAEAREKSLADNRTSLEVRLRERAAVERATAEVRERAFGKVMSERTAFEARERFERSVSDKFSASSRNGGMGPSSSSSVYNGSYHMERSEGVEGESPQRCKARLERHRRTAERAAKALAEKNMRDLLAQREQAERNRLAETLDADVKRWSSGKEGNLRALLSTLQYILGSDSGWQPIPLTEVITSAAVKRAYRKATLCVHPDKLQQRGASIQQKYICEKVFDLLKVRITLLHSSPFVEEAWNKFNSEELDYSFCKYIRLVVDYTFFALLCHKKTSPVLSYLMSQKPQLLSDCYRFIRYLNFSAKISINGNSKTTFVIELQNRYVHTDNLFDELPHRDLYSLNAQLASCSRDGNFLATWALFFRIRSAFHELDAYTFTPVLRACSALPGTERGKQVHALMIKTGTDLGTIAKTAVMDMYSKYGCLGESVKVFEEMEYRDVVTWNALVSSFLRHGLAKEALGAFRAMRRERVEITEFTLCSVLKACAFIKAFQQGKQVHGLVIVMGRDLVVLGTALIDFYSTVSYVSEAVKVFSCLSWRKDEVMRNSLIAGCVKNRRYEDAFLVMSTMRPNAVALTSALSACSENSNLWIGMQIHCVALRFGFIADTQLCNVLLDMYAKCGRISKSRLLFDGICHKTVVSCTSMIDAYGRHGHGHEALELFKKMGEEGSRLLPNSVTLLAVLSACGHSGLVKEGQEIFNIAREKFGLDPNQEHYSCFIDILGRAGLIEDAWCLFHDMVKNGIRPTAAVWATLLNACSLNLDVFRGEFAAKNLLELEPNNPGINVLLSNFYASIGRWDDVESLRSNMREKGLAKEEGSSWLNFARNCHLTTN
ncbi:unnamed protein product [Dovyalis caffra]|uniref:J domain-containing protein n=1 Tax=Dovyalis caffra TaxID=77055 RepID=A0AAV1RVP4_9ROSI|nr:unnamed protein product [Dovyalis caffra]